MAKPNKNILMKVVGVAVLGAASLSATEWQYTAPSLFEATSAFQSTGLEMWGGQSAVTMASSSSSSSGWGVASSIGPTATAWGVQSSTVYSDDVFRSYLYTGSATNADTTSGNGAFSSAWSTYNSNSSSSAVWGGGSSAWATSSSSSSGWGGSYDPWGSNSSSNGAWYTASNSNYSGAWGGGWGASTNSWGGSGGGTADYAACAAVSSWAATSSSSSSSGAPVWGGSYAAPAAAAPVSTCTSTISNLAPTSNLEPVNNSELLTSTPDLTVNDTPEPSTWMLLLSGAALVGFARRKRSA